MDKDDWNKSKLLKSSTNSSLQQGSSSSDDALAIDAVPVTRRYISAPRFLESESGHAPTDFLQQFNRKIKSEEAEKKKIQELMRVKTDPSVMIQTDTDDEIVHSSLTTAALRRAQQSKNTSSTGSPRITRTTSYAGRSERRQRAPTADVNMVASMAEKMPIMPQQYRPNRPPPYEKAVERVSEIERIKQTVNSARAKQLYAKSVQIFEQEKNDNVQPLPAAAGGITDTESISSSNSQTNLISTHQYTNNNTIGVVKTSDKKIVIKRASSTKLPPRKHTDTNTSSNNIFYQPAGSSHTAGSKASVSSASLANSFYRPTRPPPYKEAMKRKTSKPDLIDSLGGESLV